MDNNDFFFVLKLKTEHNEKSLIQTLFLIRSGESLHDAKRPVGFERHGRDVGIVGCIRVSKAIAERRGNRRAVWQE